MRWTTLALIGVLGCSGDAGGRPEADAVADGADGIDAGPDADVAPETVAPDADEVADDGEIADDGEVADDDAADTSIGDEVYGPNPPAGPAPDPLRGAPWVQHFRDDVLPYWTMSEALGTPAGNYPTYRNMVGQPSAPTRRRPRMIARQIFAYSAGYLMTGDEALLGHAQAGVDWLRTHAIDRERGGCHPELNQDGSAVAGVRTAQDHAYCMLGLAAWVFVTRDPAAEADLIAGRDLLFAPEGFFDDAKGLVRDALDATMTTPVDVEGDGGAELVAQLDPINAFLLLSQPVLASEADRARFLDDMRRLAGIITSRFEQNGFVWGVSNKLGQYGSKHADFGHSMKSFWMLLEVDKRLPDHPFHDFIAARADALVMRAFDDDNGRWANRPTGDASEQYGSDWWIYAEADQLTATLNLTDGRFDDLLAETQSNWHAFVDKARAGELVPSIRRDGTWAWGWQDGDTAKCNEWKNGYHSSEHALVLSILGAQREGGEAVLHFAVPPEDAATFIARPYVFHGREVLRTPGATHTVGARALREVEVRFRDLY